MRQLFGVVLFALVLCGCETNPQIFSEYRYAAYSWQGGSINEMVAAWGEPTDQSQLATSNHPGFKQWKSKDSKSAGNGELGSTNFVKHACDTIAYYDTYGKIIRIDVRRSKACDEVYADELESMLRPGTEPPPKVDAS